MLMCDNKYPFCCRKINIISGLFKIRTLFIQISWGALPGEGDGAPLFQGHISRRLSAVDQVCEVFGQLKVTVVFFIVLLLGH